MTYIGQEPKMTNVGECAVEGCRNPGDTWDHVLFGQKKGAGVAMKRWLHNPYNVQPCCLEHNQNRKANTLDSRRNHVYRILEEEGWAGIGIWLADCPSDGFVKRDDFQEICKIVEDYAKETK